MSFQKFFQGKKTEKRKKGRGRKEISLFLEFYLQTVLNLLQTNYKAKKDTMQM